jgi:hypothetical protein
MYTPISVQAFRLDRETEAYFGGRMARELRPSDAYNKRDEKVDRAP